MRFMSSGFFGRYDNSTSSLFMKFSCSMLFWYKKFVHWNRFDVSLFTFAKDFASRLWSCENLGSSLLLLFNQNIKKQYMRIYLNISFFGNMLGIYWGYIGNIY